MSVGEARLKLGEERKLIFANFCNLVPKEDLAEAFSRSIQEVEREIVFVARKIREYRHRRCLRPDPEFGPLPPIECETEMDILLNRDVLRWTLQFIGPETLSTDLLLPNLTVHTIEHVGHLRDAAHAVRARTEIR